MSLDPLLPVRPPERCGDRGHVLRSNGRPAWIDGRRPVFVPRGPPTAGAPTAVTGRPAMLRDLRVPGPDAGEDRPELPRRARPASGPQV
ncbi:MULTISPECIES: hypothetical protein [unclassified Streptomyces]|uniref:hypothetical protein n=1 Tax=unclassified Streptomyces TaxID=2593676 RepID=UPI000939A9A3|nr:hypothetical protein [Streptomyces sp. CB02400]